MEPSPAAVQTRYYAVMGDSIGPMLGKSHVTLNGRARDYYVRDFPGPLSIKSVLAGAAVWETDEGRFEIGPGSCLVINDQQSYSITVESREVVETFCLFFARGFVEDVQRATTTSDTALLDEPRRDLRLEFHERVRIGDSVLTPLLKRLYPAGNDESLILQVAEALVRLREDTMRDASKLPAAKASTREELLRRVHRARNVIEGSLAEPLSLHGVAREAALSPYHFHRSFTRLFRETPHEYLIRRRLEHAAALLKNTDMPVTGVCFACGFQSLGSFSSLFRKRTGASPMEFRKAAI